MKSRRRLFAALFLGSGIAGVGYQLVWTKMFTAGLGHEMPSLIAVISAFFGGLALGGWMFDRRIHLTQKPARFFGVLELTIGGWGILSVLLIPHVCRVALRLNGVQPSGIWQAFVGFLLPFISLLPATVAMGGTLPAMERSFVVFSPDKRCLGTIYALNTVGAVVGVLVSAFVLMPALGLRGCAWALAGINLFTGALALLNQGEPLKMKAAISVPSPNPVSLRRLGLTLFFTGLFGIGFEIVGVRLLAQVLEGTVFTFAAVLAVYLLGTAIGAALYQKLGRTRPAKPLLTTLIISLATANLTGAWALSRAPLLYNWGRDRLGNALWSVALAEMLVAAAVFGLSTLFLGALFSHLTQNSQRSEGGIGRAASMNTLGCTLAGMVFGTVLLPAWGAKWTLVLASAGPILLLPRINIRHAWTLLPSVILVLVLPAQFQFLKLPPDARVRDYREGAMASVAVIETADGHRALRVNNRFQMGGTAAALAERRQAHLPLLLHAAPKRALFLGPGTGITLGAASLYPGLAVDGVELVPEVIAMMPHFEPENEGPLRKPGVHVIAADARRFVRATDARYDVIVADLFHPAQDGAGFLYTREHFEAIRQCLESGGLFCQWLPLYQLDEETLRIIIRTFTSVFSQTRGFLLHFNVDIPALGLLGTRDALALPANWLEQRVTNSELRQYVKNAGFDRSMNLFGVLAAGPKTLEQYAGSAAVATDQDPRVLFTAPRFVVRRDKKPHELLIHFLSHCRATPSDLLEESPLEGTTAFAAHLAEFIEARDGYLNGLVEEDAGNLAGAIDAYLKSARRSLYFTPAYARCVGIVQMLAVTDKTAARQLFERLEQAQPAQPLGRKMLGPLLELP